jgi:hypothetical protein
MKYQINKKIVFISVVIVLIIGISYIFSKYVPQVPKDTAATPEDVVESNTKTFSNKIISFTYPDELEMPDSGMSEPLKQAFFYTQEDLAQSGEKDPVVWVDCKNPIKDIDLHINKVVSNTFTRIEGNDGMNFVLEKLELDNDQDHETLNYSRIVFNLSDSNYSCAIHIAPKRPTSLVNVTDHIFKSITSDIATEPYPQRVITKPEWGISFTKPKGWNIVEGADNEIVLYKMYGEEGGDVITINYRPHLEYLTDTDAKFGHVTYFWGIEEKKWMLSKSSEYDSSTITSPAVTEEFTLDGLPIFPGKGRWMTKIIPLDHYTFLELNITGSGYTDPLRLFVQGIRKLP